MIVYSKFLFIKNMSRYISIWTWYTWRNFIQIELMPNFKVYMSGRLGDVLFYLCIYSEKNTLTSSKILPSSATLWQLITCANRLSKFVGIIQMSENILITRDRHCYLGWARFVRKDIDVRLSPLRLFYCDLLHDTLL